MAFLKAPASFLPSLPIVKKTTTKLVNKVTLVKTNQTTRELDLVVMSLGIFYRVFLHLSFVENTFASDGARESERE
jgi:hypothetical protein